MSRIQCLPSILPAVTHQPEQGFWRCAQAGEKQEGGSKGIAVMGAAGRDFHDPAGDDPSFADVPWSLLGAINARRAPRVSFCK